MVEEFIALDKATNAKIVRFAERWGVLGLCAHNLPAGHPAIGPLIFASEGRNARSPFVTLIPEGLPWRLPVSLDDEDCPVVEYGPDNRFRTEPLDIWRSYARICRELLEEAARLHAMRGMSQKERASA